MVRLLAECLLACVFKVPPVPNTGAANPPITHPGFIDTSKGPNGLTLYNEKGEVVARCGKKDEAMHDCKLEPGVTLDDLMNAWVRAYLDVQK